MRFPFWWDGVRKVHRTSGSEAARRVNWLFWTEMARGVVKFFNAEKGYGFIMPERKVGIEERDVFVHISDVQRSGLTTLSADQIVEYEPHKDRHGRLSARNLKVVAAEPR